VVHFLLPVFNEAQNLPRLLETIAGIAQANGLDFGILAVDDGSTDDSVATLERLKERYPIRILKHDRNKGPGAAFLTGFNDILASAGNTDFIITMDADNTHSTKTVGMIVAALREGYEVAIASVYAPGGMFIGLPFVRSFLSHSCNTLYRVLFPVRGIREYTGFYRGYRVDSLRGARETLGGELFTVTGFGGMAELLIRLRQIPVFMKEVPMLVRYDQKGGKSKMRIWRTIREHLTIIGANVFRRHIA
jgi:dolichol-phosphate mannosyltransferase